MRQKILTFPIKIFRKSLKLKRKDFQKLKNQMNSENQNKFSKYFEKSKEYFKAKKLIRI